MKESAECSGLEDQCAERSLSFFACRQQNPTDAVSFRMWFRDQGSEISILSPRPTRSLSTGHHLTINVTGILTGCTLALELVAVTVTVKVPGGVPGGGGGGGGVEPPPPQPMQSSTANAPAKAQRGMCLLALPRRASRTMRSRQMGHSVQAGTLKLAGGCRSVGQGASWPRAVVVTVMVEELPEVGFGLKLAVVAAGNPATLKVKLSVKPAVREIVTL